MYVRSAATFEEWREQARPLLAVRIEARDVTWTQPGELLHAAGALEPAGAAGSDAADVRKGGTSAAPPPRISASLLRVLEAVAMYRDPGRWELMYRLAWRAMNENPALLEDAADPDVYGAVSMQRAVRRDIHKMHAFVRFRELVDAVGKTYFAWFEPQHEILRAGAVFFVRRFANMHWTVATPDGAAVWDERRLAFIDAPCAAPRPRRDDYEGLWRTYYRSICNVARINPSAMQREMPKRYWRHLPEAADIEALVRDGAAEFTKNQRESRNGGLVMPRAVKPPVAPAADGEGPQTCRRCDLWKHATQAVPGEGPGQAKIMLVGEQPGDEEDLRGHPFVGPAGRVLDQAIAAAGLQRGDVFVTNAVKHFKWEPRGKRRLHKKPGTGEIAACHVWLEQEITRVGPRVIVALGATALRALTGATRSIDGARREELSHAGGARLLATYHPSAILRAEGERVEELRGALVADLEQAGRLAAVPG